MASPICLRLLAQAVRLAASRTFCNAGNNRANSKPRRASTSRSSNSVKALRSWPDFLLISPPSRVEPQLEQIRDLAIGQRFESLSAPWFCQQKNGASYVTVRE